MVSVMLLVCTALSCTDPNTQVTVAQGTVINRLMIDSAVQAGPNAYVPPTGEELKADDGTPIGGHTAP